jgi:glutamate carboxypeptidase
MKGGLVVATGVIEALAAVDLLDGFDIVAVHNADEEVQSPTSRDLVEEAARDRDLCLCFEPGRRSGALVRGRSGVGRVLVSACGRSAHAGVNPQEGANAIVALAAIQGELAELSDFGRGISVSVGTFRGGTRRNIVPDEARCELDLRVRTAADGERILAAIRHIAGRESLPGTRIEVSGGFGRPPWAASEASEVALQRFVATAAGLGYVLGAEETGGGSDANFTGALGIPTVDGLGPVGQGSHTREEKIRLASVLERAQLVALALATWQCQRDPRG